MENDWKSLAPALLSFLGVLIGWGLKEISEYFRGASEQRQVRRKGLYQLIRLHGEMVRVQLLLEHVKDASRNWKTFEALRSRYAERYGDRSEDFIAGVKATIEKLGETDPWSAIELSHVLETYVSSKDIKLEALHRLGVEAYIRGLSTTEATFHLGIKALRKAIQREARRCGFAILIRTHLELQKRDRLSNQGDITGLSAELKSILAGMGRESMDEQVVGASPPKPSGNSASGTAPSR